jgi:pyruvate formate lyase activating enzyme
MKTVNNAKIAPLVTFVTNFRMNFTLTIGGKPFIVIVLTDKAVEAFGFMSEERQITAVEGVIFDIQRYSIHDGPGIRTNVFFKGCPLHCGWCANPESQRLSPELAIFSKRCINCGQFTPSCPHLWEDHKAGSLPPELGELRLKLCPVEAVRRIGQRRAATSIIAEVERDRPFYGDGGGLTLTGGEPTLQPDLAEALLKLAKARHISTTIETCGHTTWPVFERLLPYLDTILFDLKHIDPEIHRNFTGVSNHLSLANLRKLVAYQAPVTIRIPLIPGFNADRATLYAMGQFVSETFRGAVKRLDLLPYHKLGKSKYEALGREYPWRAYHCLTDLEVADLAEVLQSFDLKVTIGG